ncbi:MAG: UDP-N-acetylmuramate dehydrogenase, partial [Proteobacteria bacterium]|nr:UDP-N-acetylmuramate dehydrogenase [Pseudomonadota bacterium]
MKDYVSLKIGGNADVMAFPQDAADLRELVKFAWTKKFPLFYLGGGTNILVRDKGIRGIVINLNEGMKDITFLDDKKVIAGSGVKLTELLKQCGEKGLSGLEFSVGIPGVLGGAVVMNAGCYGREMCDVVEGVEIIDKKGKKGFLSNAELGFDYRKSKLPEGAVVVKVHLALSAADPADIKARIKELRAKRKESAPVARPNAGSIFKNPEGKSAGQLIDEAGLKGLSAGGAKISPEHANYIVNNGGAKAADVLSLMATIRDKVYSSTGVMLEPEIKVIGED